MAEETAAQRFDRDYGFMEADRRARGLNNQSLERASRIYVGPDGTTPATSENVHNP